MPQPSLNPKISGLTATVWHVALGTCNAMAKDHTSDLMHTDGQTTSLDRCWAEGLPDLARQAEIHAGCVEIFKLKASSLLQGRLPFQWGPTHINLKTQKPSTKATQSPKGSFLAHANRFLRTDGRVVGVDMAPPSLPAGGLTRRIDLGFGNCEADEGLVIDFGRY